MENDVRSRDLMEKFAAEKEISKEAANSELKKVLQTLEKEISGIVSGIEANNEVRIKVLSDEIQVKNERIKVLSDEIQVKDERIKVMSDEIERLKNNNKKKKKEMLLSRNANLDETEISCLPSRIGNLETKISEFSCLPLRIANLETKISEFSCLPSRIANLEKQNSWLMHQLQSRTVDKMHTSKWPWQPIERREKEDTNKIQTTTEWDKAADLVKQKNYWLMVQRQHSRMMDKILQTTKEWDPWPERVEKEDTSTNNKVHQWDKGLFERWEAERLNKKRVWEIDEDSSTTTKKKKKKN